jgi:hypothetical protein
MSTSTLAPPTALPREIRSTLSSARTRLRTLELGLGLARGVIAVAAGLLLLFALDVMLEPPLEVIRAFALFVAMLAGLTALYWVTRPLRRRLADDDIALLLEGAYPELEGGLVSSVQLTRDSDHHTSRALIERMVDRAARRMADVDVGRVVGLGPLVPLWGLIAAFFFLSVGIARNQVVAPYVAVFVQRVVHGQDIRYPKLVGFEVKQDLEVRLAKGDDLDVVVEITKGASQLDRLEIVTKYADREERRDLLRQGETLFSKSYQNVTEPFAFRVESPEHGVSSPVYRVAVVQRPRVEQYEFVLRYPDYVARPPEALTQPDLSVPSGTELVYLVVANKPLELAGLVVEQEVRGDRQRKRVWQARTGPAPVMLKDIAPAEFEEGGRWAELAETRERMKLDSKHATRALFGRLLVKKDMRFRFQLRSVEGLDTGRKPVSFNVRVVRDRKPVVSIPRPGGMKQVTPQAKVNLRIDAKDDYGVAMLQLQLQPVRGGTPDEWIKRELALPESEETPRRVTNDHQLSLADYRLVPGDSLNYKAVAFDHNIDEAQNHAFSRQYTLQVVRPEDLERMLQDRLTALKERIVSAAREEDEARKASSEFVRELGPKSVLSEDDKRRVQRLEYDQRRVTTRLTEIKRAILELKGEREANRLTEPAAMSLLGELLDGVQALAETRSPAVSRRFNDARKAPRLDPKTRASLTRIPDLQQDIADDLRRLAQRIDKWGDFTEVIQELRDLLSGEQRVIDGAKARATKGVR